MEAETSTKPSKIGILSPFLQSFYKASCYESVARDWRGLGFSYLLLQVFVFCSVVGFGFGFRVNTVLNSPDIVSMMENLPRLEVENGTLHTATNERVDIPLGQSDRAFIIVDPKDTIKDLNDCDATVLVQSKILSLRLSSHPAKLDIGKLFKKASLSGREILALLKSVAASTFLPVFLVLNFAWFLFILFKSLLLALLLKLLRSPHSIVAATRLIIVATTPSLLLAAVCVLCNLHFGRAENPIFTGIFLGYVWLAFYFCRKAKIVGT